MKKTNVTHADQVIIVKIPNTKTHESKTFTMKRDLADIVRKYKKFRPTNATTERYFLNYQNGKCTTQVIGTNKFCKTLKQIAIFLRFKDPNGYTGHSFRRTSTTILVGKGANMAFLKRHGMWKSDTVAQGYIQEFMNNKRKIGNMISNAINLEPSSSAFPSISEGHGIVRKPKTTLATSKIVPEDVTSTVISDIPEKKRKFQKRDKF
ncbi:uncharacterized protein LOC107263000 [Cephus cinctus]|uniref:Uncharacterized protein LOC107263000 n=1 Tax=Cephus cinctus TaxID=211228 RepID=A0AAJ7VWU3_CEPCN|nr:uncharacterized protein LOC107263000 [Cephus cinctus]